MTKASFFAGELCTPVIERATAKHIESRAAWKIGDFIEFHIQIRIADLIELELDQQTRSNQ